MASEDTVPTLPHVYVPIEGTDSFRTLRLQPALDVSAPLRFTFDIHSPDSDDVELETMAQVNVDEITAFSVGEKDRSYIG
jgi:hypothetical protein